jgi:outer membrane protein insertion porin family
MAGRPVGRITFRVAAMPAKAAPEGTPITYRALEPDVDALARNQLRLREGAAFDAALVSEDLGRLNRVGRFRSVEASAQALDDGSVEVIYTVRLQPLVTVVDITGNTRIPDNQLMGLIDLLEGTPVDPSALDRAARRIEQRYRDEGFYNARVGFDQEQIESAGAVIFQIREGEKLRVTQVRFGGNNNVSEQELRWQIDTTEAWLLSFIEAGELDDDVLENDVAAIVKYYKDRGYLDARCAPILTPSPDGREVLVEFQVDEGARYSVREVKVAYDGAKSIDVGGGEGVFTPEQLIGLMPIKPGDVYSDARVRASLDEIKAAYGKLGYADARVGKRELRVPGQSLVDLLLVIDEGERFRTGLVEVVGNTITQDQVVRRQIELQPDRPLDATAVAESEKRIQNTRLFDQAGVRLAIQPENPDDPEYRDIIAEVTETNTGSFNIGISAGSDGGISGLLSLTERNFDALDTPETVGEFFSGQAFRGGGQTFNISISPGDRQQNFEIGLVDPYLGTTDLSGSARLYYRNRIFRAYDEQRVGARLALGRNFGSRWRLDVPFRLETVELSDIDTDAPADYFDVAEQRLVNSIGISLQRRTIDRVVFPTKGELIQVGIDQFGLLGDDNYTQVSGEYSRYFKLDEDVLQRSSTLMLRTRADYILGGEDVAPFYDRNYLGGQNFRGFAFRGASPVGRDANGLLTDDPVGGNWLFFLGAEYQQPIFEDLVAGVLFVDSGTVTEDFGFESYRVAVGAGLRISVPFLGSQPLAFDFGFPIMKEDTDRERLFTFSLDIPF